jgi:hypothetical protein
MPARKKVKPIESVSHNERTDIPHLHMGMAEAQCGCFIAILPGSVANSILLAYTKELALTRGWRINDLAPPS